MIKKLKKKRKGNHHKNKLYKQDWLWKVMLSPIRDHFKEANLFTKKENEEEITVDI
jgi:hypothetical protein